MQTDDKKTKELLDKATKLFEQTKPFSELIMR